MWKIAFLTAGPSEVRGGGILLYNYDKALLRYPNLDVKLYSLEMSDANYFH